MSSLIPFDAYKGSEPFIFVSYAHKDGPLVFPLILALHRQGYRIWYDEGIDPGNEWPDEIARALENTSLFLVFISPHAIASKNVRNEINFALNRDKGFIAVHLVETKLPSGLELRMGDIQAILKWRMDDEHFARKIAASLSPMLTGSPSLDVRVPPGFRAAPGTAAEPDTKSGWVQEIVHAATGMAFRFIPPGTFIMGSPESEDGRSDDEIQHRVTLTQGFYLGKYQVTQAQWEKMMGSNPSRFKGVNLPVEMVSWDDCQAFLKKFGPGARLPTEAEWEYACRAGTTTAWGFGDSASNLGRYAWYGPWEWDGSKMVKGTGGNSEEKTHQVGQKLPNAWGLYDMHGNVWEWCSDWHGPYPVGAVTDPQGVQAGSYRVSRGGSWFVVSWGCRAAYRASRGPSLRNSYIGFRVVLAPLGE